LSLFIYSLYSLKVSELLHFTSAIFVFLLGYRSVPLKNMFNENLELASLLVHAQHLEVRNTHKLISFSLRASFIKTCIDLILGCAYAKIHNKTFI